VDTSGSVGDKLLAAFWQEIRAMAKRVEVVIVECDAGIHAVWRKRRYRKASMHGGGGSNFTPGFLLATGQLHDVPRHWKALAHGASHLVFLTDGDITVPDTNPAPQKVYWAIPTGCKAPTEAYGEVVPLSIEN